MTLPDGSPLLALPASVRRQIFQYIAWTRFKRGPFIRAPTLGLLDTCRQTRQEIQDLILPKSVDYLTDMNIALDAKYHSSSWLKFHIAWEGGESAFTAANLDNPLVTRLINQITRVWQVHVYAGRPREAGQGLVPLPAPLHAVAVSYLDSFLIIFSKMQDIVALVKRFHCVHWVDVDLLEHRSGRGMPFWDTRLEFPAGYGDLQSSRHQGRLYYEYIFMPFAELSNCVSAVGMWANLLQYNGTMSSEFRTYDRRGKEDVLEPGTLLDLISHNTSCAHCKRGKPREEKCKRLWKKHEGIAKAYARVKKSSCGLAHDVARLIATCDEGASYAADSLRRHRSLTRDSSGLNYFSVNNARHEVRSSGRRPESQRLSG